MEFQSLLNITAIWNQAISLARVNRRPAKRCFKKYISKIEQSKKFGTLPPSQAANY